MEIWQAIIIAIVEGITEFLPISSTAHMLIAEYFLAIPPSDFGKLFTVEIQFGAILAVVCLYWRKFFDIGKSLQFYPLLFVAFIPAAIAGFFLGEIIDASLENMIGVALALLLGGIVLLFIDKWFQGSNIDDKNITFKNAFIIGCFQCLALFPGVSRSAATIIGGMQQGYSRKQAAEFSFFLAVPTMFAASAYKLLKNTEVFSNVENLKVLAIGNLVAFLVAMMAIKFFIGFLQKYGFKVWGYYRIVVGFILLILFYINQSG